MGESDDRPALAGLTARGARRRTRRHNPPSAHDVARLAGVSQAAVSRAFTEGASISDATRDKVMQAAQELSYQPNRLARSLITGRSGLIGIVIGSPRNPFFLEALDTLSTQLSPRGLYPLVFTVRAEQDSDRMVEALLQFRVDCLVLMSAAITDELAARCRDAGVRVIYFNRRARVVDGYPSVTGANIAGPAKIADHLIDQGYRRFAYIGGSPSSTTSQERGNGFAAKLRERGFAEPMTVYGGYDWHRTGEAVRQLMAMDSPPDAVFCVNDMTAFSVIDCARQQLGLTIGRDLGVAGFDDIEGASWHTFELTSYSQPTDQMVGKLIEIIEGMPQADSASHFIVEGELKTRRSTCRDTGESD